MSLKKIAEIIEDINGSCVNTWDCTFKFLEFDGADYLKLQQDIFKTFGLHFGLIQLYRLTTIKELIEKIEDGIR